DIIWAIDPENDDWEAFLTKCKRYGAEMFESKNINYEIDIDTSTEVPQKIKARQDLWLIYKELITNLVRHSEATNAWVSFTTSKNKINLRVRDNGVGFRDQSDGNGHGIPNIKKRMDNVSPNNTLDIDSEPGKGTKWDLKFIF
ncbi:MAG: ATP-binding protein, partial [Balneola sp.]